MTLAHPLNADNLPSDPEAERQVVGACMLSKDATATAMDALGPDDFFAIPYRQAFAAIIDLAVGGKPVSTHSVVRRMAEMFTDADTAPALSATEGVSPSDCAFWAEAVKAKRGQRDLMAFTEWAHKQVAAGGDPKKLRIELEERLVALQEGKAGAVVTTAEGEEALRARIQKYIEDPDAITGMALEWGEFDQMLDGLQPGNVTIVYAPSGKFKSMFVTNIGYRLARRGHGGLWYTTEMPWLQVQERILQMEAAVNLKWLREDGVIDQHRQQIDDAIARLSDYPIYFSERDTVDIQTLRAEVLRYKKWRNIEYIIVDLVDSVSTSTFKDDSISQQSAIMRAMKGIAKAANVHVILVAHTSKGDKASRNQADLDMEDMKGSSSKYQDVDAAISVMPVRYDSERLRYVGMTREEIGIAVSRREALKVMVSVTKNRHGPFGQIIFAISLLKGGRMQPMSLGAVDLPTPQEILTDLSDDDTCGTCEHLHWSEVSCQECNCADYTAA